jgi:hypothetical protein
MASPLQNRIIQRYESLRRELAKLDQRIRRIDAELVELERQLPDGYEYPGDLPGDDEE